jgi:hypothetical protein
MQHGKGTSCHRHGAVERENAEKRAETGKAGWRERPGAKTLVFVEQFSFREYIQAFHHEFGFPSLIYFVSFVSLIRMLVSCTRSFTFYIICSEPSMSGFAGDGAFASLRVLLLVVLLLVPISYFPVFSRIGP